MKLAKVNVVGADLCVISGYYLVEDERIYTSHGVGPICIYHRCAWVCEGRTDGSSTVGRCHLSFLSIP